MVQLVNTINIPPQSHYAALSYCWGDTAADEQITTTVSNLNDHRKGIPMSELHKTIAEAVIVTRRLKIPYLWIDALCIIQNDKVDFAHEVNNMGVIYSSAYVTLAVSNSPGCGSGFLRGADTSPYHDINYSHEGRPATCVKFSRLGGAYPARWSLENEPMHTRAWCFQELILSKRIIFFSSVQPFWKCRTAALSPGGPTVKDYYWHTGLLGLLEPSNPREALANRVSWAWLVEVYSKRMLSKIEDKTKAIHAIRRDYQIGRTHGAYFAGLFQSTVHRDLAWQVSGHEKHKRDLGEMKKIYGPSYSHNQIFKYPTYSWLYYDGPVHYPAESRQVLNRFLQDMYKSTTDAMKRELELIRWPGADIFGNVNINEPLVVRGRRQLVIIPQWTATNRNVEPSSDLLSRSSAPDADGHPWIFDAKKQFFKNYMTPFWQHRLGTITFDYFDEELWEYSVDEDFTTKPYEFECLFLGSVGPDGSKTYSREGPHGLPTMYRGPQGRKALAIVLFPVSSEKADFKKRKRIGFLEGDVASALWFESGNVVELELY
jgi:hypothetical protein